MEAQVVLEREDSEYELILQRVHYREMLRTRRLMVRRFGRPTDIALVDVLLQILRGMSPSGENADQRRERISRENQIVQEDMNRNREAYEAEELAEQEQQEQQEGAHERELTEQEQQELEEREYREHAAEIEDIRRHFKQTEEQGSSLKVYQDPDCPICLNGFDDNLAPAICYPCRHVVCNTCIDAISKCVICRAPIRFRIRRDDE